MGVSENRKNSSTKFTKTKTYLGSSMCILGRLFKSQKKIYNTKNQLQTDEYPSLKVSSVKVNMENIYHLWTIISTKNGERLRLCPDIIKNYATVAGSRSQYPSIVSKSHRRERCFIGSAGGEPSRSRVIGIQFFIITNTGDHLPQIFWILESSTVFRSSTTMGRPYPKKKKKKEDNNLSNPLCP